MNWLNVSSDNHIWIFGAHVVNQLHEQSTPDQLVQNITTAFPHTRKRQNAVGEVRVTNVQFIPYVGMKMLHIKSTATSNGHAYNQSVQLLRVAFESADTPDNITFTASDGVEYSMQPMNLGTNHIKVKCSCMDFYWRFAAYNAKDKSLVGNPPPPYVKKTDRPSVNPSQVPGVCKHILKLVGELEAKGIVA